ncbi:MAG: LacI family transcriptional regulator [Capsulimonas sp.]|nr:LacI family transcriptional regulator [Capsulimonas sp.]
MPEICCPRCGSWAKQVKAGMNNGRQQYRCDACRRRYVAERKGRGYPGSLREQAAALHAEGRTLALIGETLGVTPRTLRNWFREGDPKEEEQAEPPAVSDVTHSSQSPAPSIVGDPDEAAAGRPADKMAPEAPAARRRSTIHDVAEQAGVAASTVSNYLNGKRRINASTRERVQEAIDALNFTPNALTQAIRKRRTRILGVMGHGLWDFVELPTYSIILPLLAGINRSAATAGHDVLTYTSWYTPGPHGGVRFLDGYIDGLVVIGSTLRDALLERTAAAGLPIVSALTRQVPANSGYVNVDNIGAMHAVVEHLVSVGRRRIGYVGPLHDSDHIDRYQGFSEAMTAVGLEWDPSPMEFACRSADLLTQEVVERQLHRMIQTAEKLDAIVLPNDWLAARTVEALGKRGFRVPEDVAITGFDDVPEAMHIAGGLTTVRQPFHRIGQVAVERLVAMIEGAPLSECRISLPAELIVRASTTGVHG